MSKYNHEVDEIDYLLCDALRCAQGGAPDPERSFAILRARVVADRRSARTVWSMSVPSWSGSYMSVSYWYLAPLTRIMR